MRRVYRKDCRRRLGWPTNYDKTRRSLPSFNDSPPLCSAVIRYDLISMPEYTLSSILPFVRSGLRRVRPGFTLTEYANATWTQLEKSGAPVRRLRPYAENNPDNPEGRYCGRTLRI